MPGIRQSDDLVHFIATFYDSSKFWEEVRELQEDIEFFSLYMRRNKKSNFNLSLRSYNFKFFNALWQNYGWSEDSSVVEWIYGLHIATKVIMNNFLATYDEIDRNNAILIPREWVWKITELVQSQEDLNIADFVTDYIGCSRMCVDMKNALNDLYAEHSGGTIK